MSGPPRATCSSQVRFSRQCLLSYGRPQSVFYTAHVCRTVPYFPRPADDTHVVAVQEANRGPCFDVSLCTAWEVLRGGGLSEAIFRGQHHSPLFVVPSAAVCGILLVR